MIRSMVFVGIMAWSFSIALAAEWDAPWVDGPLPAEKVMAADECVRATVGDALFDACFTPSGGGPLGPNFFRVSYSFLPAGSDSIPATVSIAVDTLGQCVFVLGAPNWAPIPECATHPEWCDIRVSPDQAVAIADSAGLGKYEGELLVELDVARDRRALVWRVSRSLGTNGEQVGECAWVYEVDVATGEAQHAATISFQY